MAKAAKAAKSEKEESKVPVDLDLVRLLTLPGRDDVTTPLVPLDGYAFVPDPSAGSPAAAPPAAGSLATAGMPVGGTTAGKTVTPATRRPALEPLAATAAAATVAAGLPTTPPAQLRATIADLLREHSAAAAAVVTPTPRAGGAPKSNTTDAHRPTAGTTGAARPASGATPTGEGGAMAAPRPTRPGTTGITRTPGTNSSAGNGRPSDPGGPGGNGGTTGKPPVVVAVEPQIDPADDSFARIRADLESCKGCSLHATRTNIVFGEGNPQALLAFIGEAPGADEDASGRPFVGRAGQLLDQILTATGIPREEVFIGNILKCRPPNNRTPTLDEMKACGVYLRRQLNLIKPRLIGCLGNTAIKYLISPTAPGITRILGQWQDSIFGIPCLPLFHPSYLLRYPSREQGSPKWQMWQAMKLLKARYDEIKQQQRST